MSESGKKEILNLENKIIRNFDLKNIKKLYLKNCKRLLKGYIKEIYIEGKKVNGNILS